MLWLRCSVPFLFVCLALYSALAFDKSYVNKMPDAFNNMALLEALDSGKCVDGVGLGSVILFEFGNWIAEETFPKPGEIDKMHLEWV